MRIERVSLRNPDSRYSNFAVELEPGLNVADGKDAASHQAADVLGHVLYGARLTEHRPTAVGDWSGGAEIEDHCARYRLQREAAQAKREGRLTITALGDNEAAASTIAELLGGLSPTIAARLLAIDLGDPHFPTWVFGERLAVEMRRLESLRTKRQPGGPSTDRDQLLARRDQLSLDIEQRLGEARARGVGLEQQLRAEQRELESCREQAQRLRAQLSVVESELAEVEAALRHGELERLVKRTTDEAHEASGQPQLEELDQQIDRWRITLADLEQREARIRGELAQHHPDESSQVLPIAEQRACISVAQRLMRDLDSEVARFAPSSKAGMCLCGDAHARLNPLVSTLARQIDALTHLVDQYEAAIRMTQLGDEAAHVARSQAEMRGHLDHLLSRRQELLRRSHLRRDADLDAGAGEGPADGVRRVDLERQAQALRAELTSCESNTAVHEKRCAEIEQQREELLDADRLARLRRELDEVTTSLQHGNAASRTDASPRPRWRGSELLSKLTDGRLREVRLTQNGRDAVVTDHIGRDIARDLLPDVDQRLLALSLHLASVSTLASWGTELPIVVVDPCHGLDDTQSAIVAVVLHDFARSGHQLYVVSQHTAAIDRWRQLGIAPLAWAAGDAEDTVRRDAIPAEAIPAVRVVETERRRFQAAVVSDEDEPKLLIGDDIERFPVFGNATQTVFGAIAIRTVGDLLEAECESVARQLNRDDVTTAIVALWQIHLGLLCFVPSIDLADADLLVSVGIGSADELIEADIDQLDRAIRDYLGSERGSRFARRGYRFSRDALRRWRLAARESRGWREAQPEWDRWKRSRDSRSQWLVGDHQRRSPTQRRRRTKSAQRKRPLKFRLSLASAVVDAPSIGPKTAKRLNGVGIQTVNDLLDADPAEVASQLDVKHITDDVVVAWQHQAQLACRIPELRSIDAQLLVGCGFTTPEAIAAANAGELHDFVKAFAATSKGKRALREAEPPKMDHVSRWIRLAHHGRQLEAA